MEPASLRVRTRNIFLDRDGVINRKMPEGSYVTRPEELTLLDGAAEAVARLNRAGMRVLVVTNQRGVSLGLYSEQDLAAIHAHLRRLLARSAGQLDGIYACIHAHGVCTCRKPAPGMFEQAFREMPRAAVENSLMIGDSLSDIQAGRNLGMPTVFIDNHPETQAKGATEARALADMVAPSLLAFVEAFLS